MKRCASLELGNGRDKERERVVERKVNSREKKDGKNQQKRIVSEGETRENGGERKEKKKERQKRRRKEGGVAPPSQGGISSGIPKSTRE